MQCNRNYSEDPSYLNTHIIQSKIIQSIVLHIVNKSKLILLEFLKFIIFFSSLFCWQNMDKIFFYEKKIKRLGRIYIYKI